MRAMYHGNKSSFVCGQLMIDNLAYELDQGRYACESSGLIMYEDTICYRLQDI